MAQLPTSFSFKFQNLEENSTDTASIFLRLRQNRPLIRAPSFRGHCRSQNLEKKKLSRKHIKVKLVTQLCMTLCDPMDCSPPGSSVHGILQVRILEWVGFPSPGALPNPGIEPRSPALQADSLLTEPPEDIWVFLSLGSTCSSWCDTSCNPKTSEKHFHMCLIGSCIQGTHIWKMWLCVWIVLMLTFDINTAFECRKDLRSSWIQEVQFSWKRTNKILPRCHKWNRFLHNEILLPSSVECLFSDLFSDFTSCYHLWFQRYSWF